MSDERDIPGDPTASEPPTSGPVSPESAAEDSSPGLSDESPPHETAATPTPLDGRAETDRERVRPLRSAAPATNGPAQPSFVFFGVVAAVSLILDVLSKVWAEVTLSQRLMGDPGIVLIPNHLTLTLAYNRGGAWGLFQNASDFIRRPFFLLVSVLAIAFIVSLYNRLTPRQHALKWGLPLVLGGALGNLTDRIVRNQVIDFIDYRADWVSMLNELLRLIWPRWSITDHWPTFNVADIAICIGVGLMAIDMLVSRRGRAGVLSASAKGSPADSDPAPSGPRHADEEGKPQPRSSAAPATETDLAAAPQAAEGTERG